MLEVKNLTKVYKSKGGVETRALDDVSVNFPETGLVFLLGKSGSGKSTLLNMIGGLDRPDAGEIVVKGRSSKDFSQSDFDSYRNTFIGFIFQEYNVLNEFNIEQNIALALQLQGKKNDRAAVNALLKEVDLEGFNKRKPNTLSGGQKQRIAIARALIKSPEIIMADEPTGALDSNTGKQVLETLKKLSKDKLVIIVSHDQDFAEEYGDRIIELKDGKILSDKSKEHVEPKAVNENIKIINGNIIDIKKGSELSEADFKQLYQMIKKQDKEVLISTGENNIAVTKKAQRISEDGKGEVFAETKEVALKQYDGKEIKFIRSHMPFSRSFKMGVSGLKSKPFRLIFTILLSVVSFAMFGIASTLMLYNPAYSLAGALEKMDRTSEAVAKEYQYTAKSVTIDNATGEVHSQGSEYENKSTTYFGEQEVKDLNSQNNNRFLGVFTLNNYNDYSRANFQFQNIGVNGEASDYYYLNGFTGLTDASAAQLASMNTVLTGTHPAALDEIAISNYHFDLIKESGALGSLSRESDIIGKELNLYFYGKNYMSQNVKMKITGVYNFGNIPQTYDGIKTAKEASVSQDERNKQVEAFMGFLSSSVYSTGYVTPEFYQTYGFVPSDNNNRMIERVWPRGITWGNTEESLEGRNVNNDEGIDTYLYEDMLAVNEGIYYYDLDFNALTKIPTLTDNDVLLPYSQFYSQKMRSDYWEPVESFHSKLGNYSSLLSQQEYDEYNMTTRYGEEAVVTTEWGEAYLRMREYFRNYGMDNSYPAGHTMAGDKEILFNAFQDLYHEESTKNYINSAFNELNSYYNEHESERPVEWEDYSELNSKIYERTITDTELTTLSNAIKDLYDGIGEDGARILKGIRGTLLLDMASEGARSQAENKAAELYGEERSVYSIFYDFLFNKGDAQVAERFDTMYTFLYRLVKGESAEITFEYRPDFLGDYVDVEVSYQHSVIKDDNIIGYVTKDVSGTIKKYNVVGFYDIPSEGGGWGTAVLTRNAIKNYLKDSYSWRNEISTSYKAPADAKYAYVIAMGTNYNQSDVALFTKTFDNYNYAMTNSVFQVVSRSTSMISELKTIFLIIGAVTGALSGLLLLNFISVSIASKNKDIGILRAVGARGSDVFKIFFSESSVITLICFILSAVTAGIVCNYLNGMLSSSMIGVKLLDYGVINILLILAIGVVISFIATFIPVFIASKKPPVEAIRSL